MVRAKEDCLRDKMGIKDHAKISFGGFMTVFLERRLNDVVLLDDTMVDG